LLEDNIVVVTALKQGRALMAIALPRHNAEHATITLVFSLLFQSRSIGCYKPSLTINIYYDITLKVFLLTWHCNQC